MVKRIKLFGLVIWEIETIDDAIEEEEELMSEPYALGMHTSQPLDQPPAFGFITNWEWEDE